MTESHHVNPMRLIDLSGENSVCCDCGAEKPAWASVNLGILVCIECVGHHRNLGVHVSVVRHLHLDKWTQSQAQTVAKIGNRISNQYYEAFLDSADKSEFANRADFVQRKYSLQWALKSESSPSDLVRQGCCPDVYEQPVLVLSLRISSFLDEIFSSGVASVTFTGLSGSQVAHFDLQLLSEGKRVSWRSLHIEKCLQENIGVRRIAIVLPSGERLSNQDIDKPAADLLNVPVFEEP